MGKTKRKKVGATGRSRLLPKESAAEMILWGGNILTMDPQKPGARAVAIKNGRFQKAGSDGEIKSLAGRKTKMIALRGRTVTPGFIDSHQHLSLYGTDLLQIDCSPGRCRTVAHIKQAVLREIKRRAPGEWIRGMGYDDTKTRDPKILTRRDLDETAPEHPVFIRHVSGHWAVVNSKALEIGGVREDAPDPIRGGLRAGPLRQVKRNPLRTGAICLCPGRDHRPSAHYAGFFPERPAEGITFGL